MSIEDTNLHTELIPKKRNLEEHTNEQKKWEKKTNEGTHHSHTHLRYHSNKERERKRTTALCRGKGFSVQGAASCQRASFAPSALGDGGAAAFVEAGENVFPPVTLAAQASMEVVLW